MAWLLAQIGTFGEAKDYVLLALLALVGGLVGAAWGDLRGKIRALEDRFNAKLREDAAGYERLTRCEERLDNLRGRKDDHNPERRT